MTTSVLAVSPSNTLTSVRNLMLSKRLGRVLVVDDSDNLIGIVSRTDLAAALKQEGPAWRQRPMESILVSEVMTTDMACLSSDDKVSKAAYVMLSRDVGGLPVKSDSSVVGIITSHDLTRCLAERGQPSMKVKDYMNPNMTKISPQQRINLVIRLMASNLDHRVVVVDEQDQPIGIITPSNLAFLRFGSRLEHRRTTGGLNLKSSRPSVLIGAVLASDVMMSPVFFTTEEAPVINAAWHMVRSRIGGLPVLNKRRQLCGVFSKKCVLRIIESLKD